MPSPEAVAEAEKYRVFDVARCTGADSEWCGTMKPGIFRKVATRYGFSALYQVELKRASRQRRRAGAAGPPDPAGSFDPASPELHPSLQAVALNRLFRLGRGKQKKSIAGVRQPFIAINAAPSSTFAPNKLVDPTNRNFDCWEIPAVPMTQLVGEHCGAEESAYSVFYVHGGGFIGGDWAGFRGFCERIHALFDGGQLFFPNYRMCPEITLLDQIDDVVEAYLYFSKRHAHAGMTPSGKPRRIVVVGDSCGGALGLRLLQELVARAKTDSAIVLPSCAAFFSPVTDLACTGGSFETMGKMYTEGTKKAGEPIGECTFDPDVIKWCFECALAAQNQPIAGIDPRVSALYGTMAGLPPVYMLATEAEVFADDTRRFCAKLREAQVPHVEDVWPCRPGGVFHAWPIFHQWMPEGNIALARIKAWADRVGAPPPIRATSLE